MPAFSAWTGRSSWWKATTVLRKAAGFLRVEEKLRTCVVKEAALTHVPYRYGTVTLLLRSRLETLTSRSCDAVRVRLCAAGEGQLERSEVNLFLSGFHLMGILNAQRTLLLIEAKHLPDLQAHVSEGLHSRSSQHLLFRRALGRNVTNFGYSRLNGPYHLCLENVENVFNCRTWVVFGTYQ